MSEKTIYRAFIARTRLLSFRLLVAALLITGLTASAWAWLAPVTKADQAALAAKAEAIAPPAPAQSSSNQERIETEVITMRPRGFEPTEITRPAGRFILVVNNRSWLEEIELRLEREDGNRVREVRRHKNKPDWRDVVDLPPGQYVLKEANHPDWACRITITSQ